MEWRSVELAACSRHPPAFGLPPRWRWRRAQQSGGGSPDARHRRGTVGCDPDRGRRNRLERRRPRQQFWAAGDRAPPERGRPDPGAGEPDDPTSGPGHRFAAEPSGRRPVSDGVAIGLLRHVGDSPRGGGVPAKCDFAVRNHGVRNQGNGWILRRPMGVGDVEPGGQERSASSGRTNACRLGRRRFDRARGPRRLAADGALVDGRTQLAAVDGALCHSTSDGRTHRHGDIGRASGGDAGRLGARFHASALRLHDRSGRSCRVLISAVRTRKRAGVGCRVCPSRLRLARHADLAGRISDQAVGVDIFRIASGTCGFPARGEIRFRCGRRADPNRSRCCCRRAPGPDRGARTSVSAARHCPTCDRARVGSAAPSRRRFKLPACPSAQPRRECRCAAASWSRSRPDRTRSAAPALRCRRPAGPPNPLVPAVVVQPPRRSLRRPPKQHRPRIPPALRQPAAHGSRRRSGGIRTAPNAMSDQRPRPCWRGPPLRPHEVRRGAPGLRRVARNRLPWRRPRSWRRPHSPRSGPAAAHQFRTSLTLEHPRIRTSRRAQQFAVVWLIKYLLHCSRGPEHNYPVRPQASSLP